MIGTGNYPNCINEMIGTENYPNGPDNLQILQIAQAGTTIHEFCKFPVHFCKMPNGAGLFANFANCLGILQNAQFCKLSATYITILFYRQSLQKTSSISCSTLMNSAQTSTETKARQGPWRGVWSTWTIWRNSRSSPTNCWFAIVIGFLYTSIFYLEAPLMSDQCEHPQAMWRTVAKMSMKNEEGRILWNCEK